MRPLLFIVILTSFLVTNINVKGQSLLNYIDSTGNKRPVRTLFEWQIKRKQILDSIQALFGKLPEDPNLRPYNSHTSDFPPFNTIIKDTFKTNSYTRYNIQFTVALHEDVTAYLYIPNQEGKPKALPAMLALHESDSSGKKSVDGQGRVDRRRNLGYARELAQRGYIVIAPDYPGYGDQRKYNFEADRYESGSMKAIFNGIRCIDFLQARSDVDRERIGVIGHSLGGHTAMYLAAFDPRLKVIVSSSGWTLNHYYNNYREDMRIKMGSRLWTKASPSYTPLALTKYNLDVDKMPFDYDELISVLAPRYFFSNSPIHDANFNVEGVRVGIANASEVYHFLKADDHLRVCYPIASHDFPKEVRMEAYRFIDKVLKAP